MAILIEASKSNAERTFPAGWGIAPPAAAWLREERSSVFPYGTPDQRTMFTPERIAVEKLDGALVAERYAPRDSFAGHQMNTPWDALHRAYFNGYAMWTYLNTPFLNQRENPAMDGRGSIFPEVEE